MRDLFAVGTLLVIFAAIAIFALWTESKTPQLEHVILREEIIIPQGYRFAGAATYGRVTSTTVYFCQHTKTGDVRTCTNGKVGKKVLLPKGFSFVGVSAHGGNGRNTVYYCRENSTERIYECISR